MKDNRFRHHNTFSDVWAILRQPSSAWVTNQLLPHFHGSARQSKGLEDWTKGSPTSRILNVDGTAKTVHFRCGPD